MPITDDLELPIKHVKITGPGVEGATNMEANEAWARLRRHLELENARWREHNTGRQERERDMKSVDDAMQVYETVQEMH